MNHSEMIAVIQAHKDGKQIQYASEITTSWTQASNPCWDFTRYKYRIKPEPKTIWVNEMRGGYHYAHDTKLSAMKGASGGINGIASSVMRAAIKYQEVIE